MCLIFFAIRQHPIYKLVVAANRDEFYTRKTAPATFWHDAPNILGGRDLEAEGTWMAMNKNGKISMVTNYRDPANINPNAPSRGKLVSTYLIDDHQPADYIHEVAKVGTAYNGFNLLVGNPDQLYYYSNYNAGIKKIDSGIYGLSNHLLDTPWPKVSLGKGKFESVLKTEKTIEPEILFEVLFDEQRANDNLLPDTGIRIERERALSSMFIKTNGYGTRSSTVILITHTNNVLFSERVYELTTFGYQTSRFEFNIAP